jgi:division protein CdvB (Snf7/Vps24/ESCRT-III family)
MASSLANNWERKNEPGFGDSIRQAISPPGPLKPRLESAYRAIQLQVQKLDQVGHRLSDKERATFRKVVEAYQKHDQARATVYANEVSEIRKMGQIVSQSKLALEAITMRLSTVQDIGDVVVALAPAITTLNAVKAGIAGVIPEAGREIGEINDVLNSVLMEAQNGSIGFSSFMSTGEDSEQVLKEAAALAETSAREKFPDLPTFSPAAASQTKE